jgi:hypothetical protein
MLRDVLGPILLQISEMTFDMVFDVASGAVITFDDIFALGVCSNIPKH